MNIYFVSLLRENFRCGRMFGSRVDYSRVFDSVSAFRR